jgi:UDP-N-acetylglucosamine transferase subunit ALG13
VAGLAKFNKLREKPLVLLSPLDWGLGHTTRCIPLIRELILLQCEVVVACTPAQRKVLEIEFQSLTFFEVPAASPLYGKNRASTILRLLLQIPKILTSIKQENSWLQQFLSTHPVDAILSDNRFGLYAPGIPCIFITHQLQVKTGLGAAFDALARRINYRFIKKFSACWVPDFEGTGSLAGEISNPHKQPKTKIKFIGGLSRFESCKDPGTESLLIILSGPEPQRTLFEKKIIAGLKDYAGTAILVRGVPGNNKLPDLSPSVQAFDHLPAARLNELVCNASIVISRCGYTSVMDLLKLQKKCILVPTPGQAEQEYLAKHLRNKQLAYTITQNNFSLSNALRQAEQFSFKKLERPMDEYKVHLREWVQELKRPK